MKTAYFDCFSGASGDMILGALVDAGLELDVLRKQLGLLKLSGYRISQEKVCRGHVAGTKVTVDLVEDHDHDEHEHHHERNLANILALINKSGLSDAVKGDARRIFERLAAAEAKAHGTTVDRVHFHEVGAVDAIVDIVGAAIGLHALGIETILVSLIRTGCGQFQYEGSRMPIPAPVTAELLCGFPTIATDIRRELTTPTGAAILTTLGTPARPSAEFRWTAVGYGAGAADLPEQPNLLRVFIGEALPTEESDEMWVVETNLDDMSPQICGYLVEKLFEAGAVDVYTCPIQMKKSRPAVLVNAIVPDGVLPRVESLVFSETTTFGIRLHRVKRKKLSREIVEVETPYGKVRVKVGKWGGEVKTVAAEYEDCKKLAEQHGVPLKAVQASAAQAIGQAR